MSARTRYPWASLSIGESATVTEVPSKRTVYTSLKHFRDEVCVRDLGYPPTLLPRFDFAWEPEPGGTFTLTITRLEDGPPASGPPAKGRIKALLLAPHLAERQAILDAHDRHLDRVSVALERGESAPMTPLDLINRAMAYDKQHGTQLARMMADFDNPPSLDDLEPYKPVNRHPLRRHDDRPDRGCSGTLAGKLQRACNTSVS